ncbi:MAG: hypothetical protein KJO75_01710 [Dactylosporangium sp.]|nr:hypothetical protein [Dactylosporangium sp.]
MTTTPSPDPVPPPFFDGSPGEIESPAELDHHLRTGSIAGLTLQGLRLDRDWPEALTTADVTDSLFVGCWLPSGDVCADLVRRGATVVPAFPDLPYPTQPSRLYQPADLVAGFAEGGFAGTYDTQVYQHFVAHGRALPPIREALAQRLHDHGIDNALSDTVNTWTAAGGGPIVGIMGGHAEPRGSVGYRAAAAIGRGLARAGCLIVTGGGPGVMEAANLGGYFAEEDPQELAAAITALATVPRFSDHDPYTKLALEVRARRARPAAGGPGWARDGGLSVPTWLYGHEPANLFAAGIAKYFSNAIREDTILRLARGGLVFAQGKAGTLQEVFQAATKSFYATDGASGPFVFLNRRYWTTTLPVESLLRPIFSRSPHGDLSHLIHLTDDPEEAVEIVVSHPRTS